MDLKAALKGQYHGGLAMLRECIEVCPDGLWRAGEYPRYSWRIAYHALFYTQLYMGQDEAAFVWWPDMPKGLSTDLWLDEDEVVPEAERADEPWMTQAEALAYLAYVDGLVDATVDGLDLSATETGFPWYPNMGKLSHELMNLRHLQGHVGQLSERLMDHGIDIRWRR